MATALLAHLAATGGMPPAGAWAIDPARAVVAFSGRVSFLAPTISARFAGVAGQVEVADSCGGVRVEVDVTSMTTGNRAYDEVIGAIDPFDAARFQLAVYESTRVLWTATGADIEGRLVGGRAGDRGGRRSRGAVVAAGHGRPGGAGRGGAGGPGPGPPGSDPASRGCPALGMTGVPGLLAQRRARCDLTGSCWQETAVLEGTEEGS